MEVEARQYHFGKELTDDYNFDIRPLIRKNFDFYEFCLEAIDKINETGSKLKGYVIITGKQHFLGYTAGDGIKTQVVTYARIMKDLTGGGIIRNNSEIEYLQSTLKRQYLVGDIVFGPAMIRERIQYDGCLQFGEIKDITYNQYEQFLQFYDEYNEKIRLVCRRFNFYVYYSNRDFKNKLTEQHSKSLDELKEELAKHLIESRNDDINEVILGEEKTK